MPSFDSLFIVSHPGYCECFFAPNRMGSVGRGWEGKMFIESL